MGRYTCGVGTDEYCGMLVDYDKKKVGSFGHPTLNKKKLMPRIVKKEKKIGRFSNEKLAYTLQKAINGIPTERLSKLKSRQLIIPCIDNEYLFWDAKGEFNKYLSRVEVKYWEHNIKLSRFGMFLRKKIFRIKGKDINHFYHFFAVFTFKKIPKKGYLELEWI